MDIHDPYTHQTSKSHRTRCVGGQLVYFGTRVGSMYTTFPVRCDSQYQS